MKILTTPNPVLRQVAKPVLSWNRSLQRQVEQMMAALKTATDPEGVGLAAPQVGLSKQIFLINLNRQVEVFVNPKILSVSEKMLSQVHNNPKKRWLEGCLSVPKIWGFVDRPYSVTLTYQTPQITPQGFVLIDKKAEFKDAQSAYIQHEKDHLDGILFTDHLLSQQGQIYKETPDGLEPIKLIP